MKTGKLMKFPREGGDVQAYLYRDANLFRASLYVTAQGARTREPIHTIADPDEDAGGGRGALLGRDPLPEASVKSSERFFIDGVICRLDGDGLPVANLSVGGLFAATERPPLLGQVVRLELLLGERESYEVVGRVTWLNDGLGAAGPQLPQRVRSAASPRSACPPSSPSSTS